YHCQSHFGAHSTVTLVPTVIDDGPTSCAILGWLLMWSTLNSMRCLAPCVSMIVTPAASTSELSSFITSRLSTKAIARMVLRALPWAPLVGEQYASRLETRIV